MIRDENHDKYMELAFLAREIYSEEVKQHIARISSVGSNVDLKADRFLEIFRMLKTNYEQQKGGM